ncbi:MAG: radical SAM family heme chaperone HemW [Balneolaceae bacterium]
MAGIYIHIPFCKQACSYCNFYFLTRRELQQPFVDALIEEIRSYRGHPFSEQVFQTIYIGGGTPSLLSIQQLESIFGTLHDVFDIEAGEVTLEMNPDDVTKEFLRDIRGIGINRASMGIQSFDPDLLLSMHRAHNPREAQSALEMIQQTNFPSFTADLIYGNPGQTSAALEKDIMRLLSYDPPHVSAYSLTIEPNTRLGKQVKLGRIEEPDEEKVAEQFDLVEENLSSHGLMRYEISNFSKPGKEAVHNSNYWRHINYLGLGPSAHSLFWQDAGAIRWNNAKDIRTYLNKEWASLREDEQQLDLKDLAEERLMLGLRTRWGVSPGRLADKYGYKFSSSQLQWLGRQKKENIFEERDNSLRLSAEGLRIADYLTLELISRHSSS